MGHLQPVRALEKAGFRVVRQGKHVVMTHGSRILTIPRNALDTCRTLGFSDVNAVTMGGIVRDAGLTVERFRALL